MDQEFPNYLLQHDAVEDDLEILELLDAGFPREVYHRADHFHEMSQLAFFKRFRLTKETTLNLLSQIEHELEYTTDRNQSIAPIEQLLLTLRFYSTGGHIQSIADFGGAHKSTAHRIIHKVSEAIARLRPLYINMPATEAELQKAQGEFYNISAFPRVIGSVDGTHIRVQSPGGEDAEVYRNRKGYFSINTQVVCDANMKIQDILARWPGSAHDATIFNSSRIRARFENHEFGNCFLLGDSAYNGRRYLLTPLLHPTTRAEQLYNEAQIRTRGVIEKLFGIWKRRFPILAYGSRVKVQNTLTIIVATAILHNIALTMREDVPELPEDINVEEFNHLLQEVDNEIGNIQHPNVNFPVRTALIDNYFRNLQ